MRDQSSVRVARGVDPTCRRRAYRDRKRALVAMSISQRGARILGPRVPLRAVHCPRCGAWHVIPVGSSW